MEPYRMSLTSLVCCWVLMNFWNIEIWSSRSLRCWRRSCFFWCCFPLICYSIMNSDLSRSVSSRSTLAYMSRAKATKILIPIITEKYQNAMK